MKGRIILGAAIAVLSLAASCGAQLPPGKWWKDPEWVRNLGLTKIQIEKLEEHFRVVRPKLIDLTAEAQKAEIDLEATIERTPFDEKKAAAAGDRVVDARCRVMRAEMGILFAARGILTDDQCSMIRARMEKMDRPEGGRPGGPRPPFGGPPPRRDGFGNRPPPPAGPPEGEAPDRQRRPPGDQP